MNSLTELHLRPQSFDGAAGSRDGLLIGALRPGFHQFGVGLSRKRNGLFFKKCRSFKTEDGGELEKKRKKFGTFKEIQILKSLKSNILGKFNLGLESDVDFLAKMEGLLSSAAVQIGRYIVTMMSTGVVLAVGFQLSGGDSQMNTLIWYSWLGGVIIGTMIGANMVLEEHCRAGPRNVVITERKELQ